MEEFSTVSEIVARARELMGQKYIVLVAESEAGAWTGYSAFRSIREQKRTGLPEDSRQLVMAGPVPDPFDPKEIYAPPVPAN
jgi:hypothetical protein